MLIIIGNTDLTNCVLKDSYSIQLERNYTEWTDANYNKHRIYNSNKVKGSVGIICGSSTGISETAFFELLQNNTVDNVLTVTLYVPNVGSMESIECYYKLQSTSFDRNGKNVLTLTLEER